MAEAKKGLGFAEATQKSMPHKVRRKIWAEKDYVYWLSPDGDSGEGEGPLYDENDNTFFPSAEDVIATDWEII
jgi:hypothetical protein